jgi:predicted outer membrane repeat protein
MSNNMTGTRMFSGTVAIFYWAVIMLLLPAAEVPAANLPVPNTYITIQEAIDLANPGDTIVVSSGTHRLYAGNITINKDSLTLKSAHGALRTIIQGRGNGPVITIGENIKAVIEGFTITATDTAATPALKGGGVYCAASSSPRITNNIIIGNNAVFGGGIYCDDLSSPVIIKNIIRQNHASGSGGGIFSYRASPEITGNSIVDNQASNSGGGIYCERDSPQVSNNVIWKNKSRFGGGIAGDRSTGVLINNTISYNDAEYGGGIMLESGIMKMVNVILWKNIDDLYAETLGSASRPDHSVIGDGDFRGLNGNIAADPLFMDPLEGDFRLQPDSPCIDAGNQEPIYYDRDGSRNDMGATGGPDAHAGHVELAPNFR